MIKLHKILQNPILIIVSVMGFAWLGWSSYINQMNRPNYAEHNLLANSDFEAVDSSNVPLQWSVHETNTIEYAFSRGPGYLGGRAVGVTVKDDHNGSLDFASPVTTVLSNDSYLYKGYYKSDVPFSLLIRYYYKNGGSDLHFIRHYTLSKDWTTNSIAFKTEDQVSRVQVVYRLAAPGTLWLDKSYLDQRSSDLSLLDKPALSSSNIIKNHDLSEKIGSLPAEWNWFSAGNNVAQFAFKQEDNISYLRTTITSYQSGEAEWNHTPLPVEPGQYMQFSVDYRSDAPVHIVAEYALDDRTRSFMTLAELPPSSEWTRVQAVAEAPMRAVEVSMNAKISQNGTLDTKAYIVQDITKQGDRQFKRPLVSIAFDDDWASSYQIASRILGYADYKATFYINPQSIGERSFLNDAQLRDLLKTGNEIGSAGNERVDLTTLNSKQLKRQMRLARDYFKAEFAMQEVDFAPWYGHYDAEVEGLATQYFRSSLTTDEGINTKQNFDPYNLKTLYVNKDMTPKRFQAALEEARSRSGWLILVYHRVEDNQTSKDIVPSKVFAEQIELIRRSNMSVRTVGSAVDEVQGE